MYGGPGNGIGADTRTPVYSSLLNEKNFIFHLINVERNKSE